MRLTKAFFEDVRELIVSARAGVARGIDLVQVHTNFEIGRRIVEQELIGKERAAYGKEVMKALSERLTHEFGKGFSHTNLKLMRLFYLQNQHRIGQTLTDQLGTSSKFEKPAAVKKSQSPTAKPSAREKVSRRLTHSQFPRHGQGNWLRRLKPRRAHSP